MANIPDIGGGWDEVIGGEFEKPYYTELREFLKQEYMHHEIYPGMYDIFNALKLTPYDSVSVVILGQDPYHEPGQAHGLSFSVREGIALPPSLKNIYREIEADVGIKEPEKGDLSSWARQGVLLMNTVLTVRRGAANSHKGKGWEIFTDAVIKAVNDRDVPTAFVLWGANARSKKTLITNPVHGIFESAHPSPLSAYSGFFGSRVFSRVNRFLLENERPIINWEIK